MAIKAIAVDDENTHHLLIGLNRENVDSILRGDMFTLPRGAAPLTANSEIVIVFAEKRAMLTTDQINDVHHLHWVEHWPIRKDRTASAHELADHQEVFRGAGADAGGAAPRQQTGSLQTHHRRTNAGEASSRISDARDPSGSVVGRVFVADGKSLQVVELAC
jgi:hypothetical protein